MLRHLDPPAPREVVGRDALRAQDLVERAGGHDAAAAPARSGPHIDDVVRRTHHLLVVLDHDH